MYEPQNLIIKNFGPIGSLSYNFSNKVILLTGENLTDEGQDSNGSGKSYLLEAINYAATGSSFRKITDSELVKEGELEGYVYFQLYNKPLQRTLIVERNIYSGAKSSKLKVVIKDPKVPEELWEQKKITSINEGNKFILEELGLSREDILNYFMISKEKYVSFFSSSDNDKKELIGRFSKANLVDELIPKVEADKAKKTAEVVKIEKEILSLEAKVEVLREEEDPEKLEQLKTQNELEINVLLEQVAELEAENTKLTDLEWELTEEVVKLEKELVRMPDLNLTRDKIKSNKLSLEQINFEVKKLRDNRKETDELLSSIERNLAGIVECPKCEHKFNAADPDFDVEEGELIKPELVEMLAAVDTEISSARIKVPEIEAKIQELNDEINKQNRNVSEINSKISSFNSKIRIGKTSIENNKKLIDRKGKEAVELSEKIFEPKKNEAKIKDFQKQLKVKDKELKEAILKESEFDTWILNFKSFKTFLANKSLINITNQTNLYLEKLGSSIRVKFEGEKEVNRGKEKREKISIRIFKFGEDKGNFGKLSGGEKARVEIAVILALSSLINMASGTGGMNLVIIDEILESLDSTGLRAILKAMNGIDQHVILVTHGKIDSSEGFKNVCISKVNGTSSLKIS